MTYERRIARLFGLTDAAWLRHANPWSVWTRFTVLPLLLLAAWSRAWIGGWYLLPLLLALVWNWLNPRVFPPAPSTNNWPSKAVLGERVWMNRDIVPVPPSHRTPLLHILNLGAGVGLLFCIGGVAAFAIWPTIFGMAIVYLCKLWFMDRMVWLYDETKDSVAEYRSWLY